MPDAVPPAVPGPPRRAIRSFVKRGGRVTVAQQRALAGLWPRYGIDYTGRPIDLNVLFGRCAPRTLEIGFGDGESLVALAQAQPARDYLGVEVHAPGVGHCLLGAAAAGLCNLRLMRHDAVEVLEHSLTPAALDEVLIYFADPWPKKRHHKRRLIQPPFVTLLASRIAAGGHLRLATDWEPYAEWMLEVLGASPQFRNVAGAARYAPRPAERPLTKFERRGSRLGHIARDLEFERLRE
ncbi:MAG TPA: tRNA (guanosine(46)-N7)-methyltransferase TrmB [Steroidobacteraceae bacterium]|nr:tRNA (guanosine(46)-N7)-methyltransferase TrmB [Steroidobacteraceae bacterium]